MELAMENRLNTLTALVEETLDRLLPAAPESLPQRHVMDAMRYSLKAGGKRIRPILTLEFCRLCGGMEQRATVPACALEMIHTFSLIHDDLPCMDDDDFRRGCPSCHKAFGEANALLAGDALAVLPFQILAEADLPAELRVQLIAELASATSAYGMIGGQTVDLENEQRTDVDLENLKGMYALKTGALIRAACRMGCIAAGAPERIPAADAYAERLGLAFQIVDDILDVTGTQELLGKPIGSDEAQNKTTFVTLLGLEGARKEADRLTQEALVCTESFADSGFLRALTEMLLCRFH